ncbi:MAG TPA: type II toxin-antitoxin system VapB family antitoxin [Dehalococcoidia bacterium]|jgi:Arc/MetJ family transcription regulator|nr:type II toxin-antitoxin system VapB family antitoxin [Dehalococcoidia bacterium]
MRTNIVLDDDDLVKEAQELSQIKTKRELIDLALREFVENRKRLDLRELRGVADLHADYEHKSAREAGGNS